MFASPLFLVAAAVGAMVPLLLHLMQYRKRQTLPFPTLRFLKTAQKRSSRRIRIENALLWLVRTLIMLLLGLAFAMPMLRSSGYAWLGDSPRDVALVLDASYSMGYHTGRETVWDKALTCARTVIEGLGDNDRYCLFLAREQPEPILAEPVADKAQGLDRLKALAPGTGSSQLAPAVLEALKALKKDARNREQELFILTDNQALPWQGFAEGGAWQPESVEAKTAFFAALLGVSAPENASPDAVELRPAVARPGSPAQVISSVRQTGQAAETTLTLFVDGEQIGRRPVRRGDPDASAPIFHLPALPVGIHPARLETPDDNLPIDNSFHFLIRVENPQPVLCVGSVEDAFFVKTALLAGAGKAQPGISTVPPERVATEDLSAYACVFLCNALPVSGQALTALESYAKGGGLLVLFPGSSAPHDAYKPWSCLPAFPSRIDEIPVSRRRHTLAWDLPQHEFLRGLREAATPPVLTVRRRLAFDTLHEQGHRLLTMGPETPFLLQRDFGQGHVLLFAVSAERSWSDFPLSPFFLPLVLQCVDYSSGFGKKSPYLWATPSLPLGDYLPLADRATELRGPDQKSLPISSAVLEGRTVQVAEGLAHPGIYLLASTSQPTPVPSLAVNLRREESDLTPIAAEQAATRLGLPEARRVQVAPDLETLQRLIREHRVGRTFGEQLLWAALLLIMFEFAYANVLLKAGPRLSEQLRIDPSGSVKGHAVPAGAPAPSDS